VLRLMQDDGMHPNARGVAANVEAIGPAVLELVERARR
jgi:acyl-CoA thioesterase-1